MPDPNAIPGNSYYPCAHCHQGHCVCTAPGTAGEAARNARVYHLEEIRCAQHPQEVFFCVNELNNHVAEKHPQSVEPRVGASNGVVWQSLQGESTL